MEEPSPGTRDRIRADRLLSDMRKASRKNDCDCGPVVLAFCQDVQAEAHDWPEAFFAPRTWRIRRPEPDAAELAEVAALLRAGQRPVIVAGGGVIYSGAEARLADFARTHRIPIVETQAGKGAVDWSDPLNHGSPGVTGTDAGNALVAAADVILGIGTRFQDFTTGSWTAFANEGRKLISVNVTGYDGMKHGAVPLVADALVALDRLGAALGDHRFAEPHPAPRAAWFALSDRATAAPGQAGLPSDAQVIGAVQRQAGPDTVVMCAAGTMPGALQVLWRAAPGGYHMEYGYSCMGYEIAGALGIAMARPAAHVVCMVGDGSYMMANSELATAVMMRVPFTVVLTDNRGYGCINRLQQECGGAEFNNMYATSNIAVQPQIDFVAHAASMGAHAVKADGIAALEREIAAARSRDVPTVIVIDTEAETGASIGGGWWDVAVPQVGATDRLREARAGYDANTAKQQLVN
ncbi:3D-(3,5/4)-trihydroxycyclohexane-1,2-dione acylhydrolase (decyclizing) [Paracoccus contaminans]|uniref:3D-(3,5/4)-trihydroxycyclohexane-1,2-dione acylhydrolase (Decyclizing) n=1 Tax=Paracoccus contaminans TaxID=1945662 RepID=A0A1W6D0L6_9RHOB|nr:3D-(3,5/4)-trihydroxycyclohexane-1,2-dione acylhydrolase (decyclizing) [Paracoccus contaminans]